MDIDIVKLVYVIKYIVDGFILFLLCIFIGKVLNRIINSIVEYIKDKQKEKENERQNQNKWHN